MKFARLTNCSDAFLPERATTGAAGYDFKAYKDTIIPAHSIAIVSTGIKCYLESNQVLILAVRSSMPKKMGLILANGIGIVDQDYVDNSSNEGNIGFQLYNITDQDIEIKRGDRIGQGYVTNFYITEDDTTNIQRTGGWGSTG